LNEERRTHQRGTIERRTQNNRMMNEPNDKPSETKNAVFMHPGASGCWVIHRSQDLGLLRPFEYPIAFEHRESLEQRREKSFLAGRAFYKEIRNQRVTWAQLCSTME
ncbi:MAG TPA: hypothetical protein VEC99_08440, partial [Clostridia bacterium]|nr:hypothetical protein [Clostridia bacterium]